MKMSIKMLERTKKYYEVEFIEKERSPQDIATEWNTYPNKIRRELQKYGFKLRDKSEAQKIALQKGRHKHPTKGQHRPEHTKILISETMAKKWEAMTDQERQRRMILGKQQWEAMTDLEKEAFQTAALEAIRETAREGSKLENFLLKSLRNMGYEVSFHTEHILPNTNLQTDLYLPAHHTVIEVDGPSHFFPIWGQENLEKNINADAKKNSTLLTYGFAIIRVKHIAKTISEIHKRKLLSEVIRALQKIKEKFPPLEKRLIEVELN